MGQFGGYQTKMVAITQIGIPISRNGRRFPYLPGFLLSTITPNIIAEIAPIIN